MGKLGICVRRGVARRGVCAQCGALCSVRAAVLQGAAGARSRARAPAARQIAAAGPGELVARAERRLGATVQDALRVAHVRLCAALPLVFSKNGGSFHCESTVVSRSVSRGEQSSLFSCTRTCSSVARAERCRQGARELPAHRVSREPRLDAPVRHVLDRYDSPAIPSASFRIHALTRPDPRASLVDYYVARAQAAGGVAYRV